MSKINLTSVQGNQQNEDALFACQKFAFVIDGASGLYREQVSDYESDAQWFASSLSHYLGQSLADFSRSIGEHVREACQLLLAEYLTILSRKDLAYEPEKLPNATVSIVRFNDELAELELFQLGDSPILLETEEELLIFDDPKLGTCDQRALSRMIEIAQTEGLSIKSARTKVTDILQENRSLKNTDQGYWILDPTAQGIQGARVESRPLAQVKRLAIMSDGLWESYDTLHLYAQPVDLFNRLFSGDTLGSIIAEMRDCQRKDPLYNDYPRFKLMDDATVLTYDFQSN